MKQASRQALDTDPLLGLKWCQICDIIPPEGDEDWCHCTPCPRCGKTGEPSCIRDHEHIPDAVSLTEAAKATGISRDVIYKWVRNDWINSRKVLGNVETAPIVVSLYEVQHFKPPKRGWPTGVKRCRGCGRAFVKGHWCDELDMAGNMILADGTMKEASNEKLNQVANSKRGVLRDAAHLMLAYRYMILDWDED